MPCFYRKIACTDVAGLAANHEHCILLFTVVPFVHELCVFTLCDRRPASHVTAHSSFADLLSCGLLGHWATSCD